MADADAAEFGGGLFGCFQAPDYCALATCCYPCAKGVVAERAGLGSSWLWTPLMCLVSPASGCLLATLVRGRAEERAGHESGCFANFLASVFCTPCAAAQELRGTDALRAAAAADDARLLSGGAYASKELRSIRDESDHL